MESDMKSHMKFADDWSVGLAFVAGRLVPSAKADSICSTLASRHCRAGLSHVAAGAAGAWFVPP
jgi:hypothetical protein